MLKKLKIKFILITMSIFIIMLGVIFALLYYSTSRNLEIESIQMMETIASNPSGQMMPNSPNDNVRLPYFSVIVNHAGDAIEIGGGYFDLSDRDYLKGILESTYESHSEIGVLKDYNLRFLKHELSNGYCYVFSDITSEQSILHHLVNTLLLVGALAIVLFFGISLLLAKWTVKPVEKAWINQKQFVADASHELKTPLTVIMMDAELLNASECAENDRISLSGNIITMSKQMRGLVENLLELAKIDNGTIHEKVQNVILSDVISESAMQFEPIFFEKDMPFTYEIEPNIQLNGYEQHLKQLVDIFLDNATKYASPGGETILTFKKTATKSCVLKVSNQGEPLSEDEIKNIFKRFYRTDKVRTMSHSYGLGLSIAESIALEHKGKIWAESKYGYNNFIVEFPVK